MKKVAILDRIVFQYRLDFFNQLKEELEKKGIELILLYGKPAKNQAKKKDSVDVDWGVYVPNKIISIAGREVIWQPALKYLKDVDLIIMEQANRLLINYWLIFTRSNKRFKVAYWGHGKNMQTTDNSLANAFKNYFIKHVDWWFAYTEGVKEHLINHNFDGERVTVVQNAIDTNFLKRTYESISDDKVAKLKADLGITSDNVGIYIGAIYKEKRMDFLLAAANKIKEQIKDFQLIVIGAGADQHLAENAAAENTWIKYLGPKFNEEKVLYFKLASLFLMPGLVGLAVLDSFALQTPMITTDYPFHSPEIEYLKNGYNGIMTENHLDDYVEKVVATIRNKELYESLVRGCIESSGIYTHEKMLANFTNGIENCLNS